MSSRLDTSPEAAVMLPMDVSYAEVQLAVAGFLARYQGNTRSQYQIDLNCFFAWCRANHLEVFKAKRPHIELFVRYLDEVCRYKPATVARRTGTVCGFYRLAAIDGVIPASPAEYIRRPKVPFESPRLGLSHLQFEAIIAASRAREVDEALVALLGLLGLRVSEACNVQVEDFGFSHGHRTLRVLGKGGKIIVMPLAPAVTRAIERAAGSRSSGPLLHTTTGAQMDRYAATRIVKRLAKQIGFTGPLSPHSLRHTYVTTMLDAGVSLRDVQIAARHADARTTTRYDRARNNLDRHGNYVLAAFMGGA